MCSISFKTRGEIAAECGIHPRTVSRKLTAFAPDLAKGQLVPPAYQKLFYENYGWPADVNRKLYEEIELPGPPPPLPTA